MRRRNPALSNPIRRPRTRTVRDVGPAATFIAAVLATFVALALAAFMLPRDLVLPTLATLYFVLAALLALVAWRAQQRPDDDALTYWDVAGALTLFGICAATLLDADQLVRLVEGTYRDE